MFGNHNDHGTQFSGNGFEIGVTVSATQLILPTFFSFYFLLLFFKISILSLGNSGISLSPLATRGASMSR